MLNVWQAACLLSLLCGDKSFTPRRFRNGFKLVG